MSRRRRAEKRTIEPDALFGNLVLAKFINKLMLDGKKAVARRIVYGALEEFAKKVSAEDSVAAFEQALENAKPTLEVKSRRIGGATYQVPVEIPADRRTSIAMRWIILHSRSKPGRSMEQGLIMELVDCFNNQGSTIKKKRRHAPNGRSKQSLRSLQVVE